MKFYLDEDVSPRVAEILRRMGCAARSTQEAGNRGADDERQLQYAARLEHVLVTRNRNDFIGFTVQFFAESRPHAGVVIVPRSIPASDPGFLARLLFRLSSCYPKGLPPYTVIFLQSR